MTLIKSENKTSCVFECLVPISCSHLALKAVWIIHRLLKCVFGFCVKNTTLRFSRASCERETSKVVALKVFVYASAGYSSSNIVHMATLALDWQPRRCPLMHGSRAMRINGKNNGDPIMDCRQHTLAMKRTESYICDTLNTERSRTDRPPPAAPGVAYRPRWSRVNGPRYCLGNCWN